MSRLILAFVALAGVAGCNSSFDVKKAYGTYDVQVSAFGKMDTTMAVVGQGAEDNLDFYFVYGFSPTADQTTAGIQVKRSDKKLTVELQPIHVDLATGAEDGTVTGEGEIVGGSKSTPSTFTLTFNVVGAENQMLSYALTGTEQQ